MSKIYDKAVALQKRANRAEERIKELEAAASCLLDYAKDNVPYGECYSWLSPHPIDVMEKLLK